MRAATTQETAAKSKVGSGEIDEETYGVAEKRQTRKEPKTNADTKHNQTSTYFTPSNTQASLS